MASEVKRQCLCCGREWLFSGLMPRAIYRHTGEHVELTGYCCSLICAIRWTHRDAQRVPGYYETYELAR